MYSVPGGGGGGLSTYPAYILCNSSISISLVNFEDELMGLILRKGSSTIRPLHSIGLMLSVIMFKSLKLSLSISVTLILCIFYFTKKITQLRGIGLVPMDATC